MKDIWVISDTHFFHENVLRFTNSKGDIIRPFIDIKEMNETILERWNSVVKPGDIVYHLGDVTFNNGELFKSFWPRLNGSKRLIIGNHDNIKWLSSGGFFKKVMLWRVWKEEGLIFTHIPINKNNLRVKDGTPMFNVHGHIHHNPSPEGPYFNVSCENINYTPVHIEELVIRVKKENRQFTHIKPPKYPKTLTRG